MSKIERDAAIVILAQAAKAGDWSFQAFKVTYGDTEEEQEYIERLVDSLGMLKYCSSYYVGSRFVSVYEWK